MMNSKNSFVLMHLGFLIYSLYTVTGKIASKYDFFSKYFIIFYSVMILILFIYAIIWQQILKFHKLSFASINKSITIIWGMLWGKLFFNEEITLKRLLSIILIVIGISILAVSDNKEEA